MTSFVLQKASELVLHKLGLLILVFCHLLAGTQRIEFSSILIKGVSRFIFDGIDFGGEKVFEVLAGDCLHCRFSDFEFEIKRGGSITLYFGQQH